MTNENEQWKSIAGYEGLYEVSTTGRVRGFEYGGYRRKEPRLKNISVGKNGYVMVVLYKDKKATGLYVSRLVLSTFKGFEIGKNDCRHLDGNKLNNNLDNLAWGTRKENEADKLLHGTRANGEKNGQSKLTVNQVQEIKGLLFGGKTTYEIASLFNICQQNVSSIKLGRTWKNV